MTEPAVESVDAARHRALADPSRLAILRFLEAAEAPLGVGALADRVGLHANTVRWHLGILVDAGLATEEGVSSGERGRPRFGYRIVPGALDQHPGGFRLLADLLAEVVMRGGDAATIEAVSRERGAALIEAVAADERASAIPAVMGLLEQFGFQPRLRRARKGQRIEMRPCPFGDTAVNYRSVVCPLHLGLMQGAFAHLGDTMDATSLEPFVEPDLCVAHLARAQQPPRRP